MDRGTSTSDVWDSFFSDFYLRAYAGDERDAEAEAQAVAAARLSGCAAGGELLDVPCGFGRHSIPLAGAGYRVTGVDRSGTLLGEARRRGSGPEPGSTDPRGASPPYAPPLPGRPGPEGITLQVPGRTRMDGAYDAESSTDHRRIRAEFVQADYRQLPFADDSFDAALNLFTSLGYLGDEEDVKVLAEIRRVLRPNAKLVIETMHRDRLVKGFSDNDWAMIGEGRLRLDQRTFDPVGGVAQTTQTLVDSNGARESHTWTVRVYTATELIALVERAGFVEIKCWGGWEFEPFTPSSRLVIVATNIADF